MTFETFIKSLFFALAHRLFYNPRMKIICGLFILFSLCGFCFAQIKPCQLSLADSPAIRNLKLGIDKQSAISVVRQVPNVMLDSDAIMLRPKDEDLSEIRETFYEDRLSSFDILYKQGDFQWRSAREFAANLSKNLNLSYEYWKFAKQSNAFADMNCKEFTIQINTVLKEIKVTDLTAIEKMKKESENKKRAFKP